MTRRIVADLHVHTTTSDGVLSLEEIPAAAHRAGLEAVAITDHDRLHPQISRPIGRSNGVTIIRGIELRVELRAGERIDVLGYGVTESRELEQLIEYLQDDRVDRGRRMVEAVEAELGVSLDIDIARGLGRPHIARAIEEHPETAYDVRRSFEELIGDDGPCYVARDVPAVDEGVSILTDACSVVAVAHPLRYDHVSSALEIAGETGAIERWYPYSEDVDERRVAAAVAEDGLLATGGSDAHGTSLGKNGLDSESFEHFLEGGGIA